MLRKVAVFFSRRKKRKKIPEGYAECYSCGAVLPKEEMHEIIMYFSEPTKVYICDKCINLPPSFWRKKHVE